MTEPVQTIDVLLAEHADLERQLADPELHAKPDQARRVGRRFARLAPIVATYRKLAAARDDLETARELSKETFSSQGDAESWLGEHWPSLLKAGIDQVTLTEDGRVEYGPMSLHPAQE